MNQAILFNDDLIFDRIQNAWRITALLSGQRVTIYFHSVALSTVKSIDNNTKFDLEDKVALWLDENEPEGDDLHINID